MASRNARRGRTARSLRLVSNWVNDDGSVGFNRILDPRERVVVWACPSGALKDLQQCEQLVVAVTHPPPRGRKGFCYKGRLTAASRAFGTPAGTKVNFCESSIYGLAKKKR